jgi:hypothetical protein
MKRVLFVILTMGLLSNAQGQLKAKAKCPDFYVDVLNGTVNDIKPNYTPNEIKEKFLLLYQARLYRGRPEIHRQDEPSVVGHKTQFPVQKPRQSQNKG